MSKPPDPLTATEEELRADLSQVLSALERVSLVSEMEDHLRRVYFRRVRIMALVALAIMIGTTARAATYQCAATRADRYTGRGPATRLTRTAFLHFLVSAGPDNGMEMAKLLAWCFIAGFSERLIPSALDQLGGRLSVRGGDQKGP
jgi:hypothetical protein